LKKITIETTCVIRNNEEHLQDHTWRYGWTAPREPSYSLPAWFIDSFESWVLDRNPPGGFFQLLLCNDLGAYSKADHISVSCMKDMLSYLYHHAPQDCYGSHKKVVEWCDPRYHARLEPRECRRILKGKVKNA
jgi:hypothetical protein